MSYGVFGYHLLLRTENWKHCSEIIFKCVNSTMRPIFNKNFVEKWCLWVSWTMHGGTHRNISKVLDHASKKKKKKVKCRRNKFSAIQTYTMCFEWIDFYLTLYLTLVFLSMKCKRYGSMENYWSYHKFN